MQNMSETYIYIYISQEWQWFCTQSHPFPYYINLVFRLTSPLKSGLGFFCEKCNFKSELKFHRHTGFVETLHYETLWLLSLTSKIFLDLASY